MVLLRFWIARICIAAAAVLLPLPGAASTPAGNGDPLERLAALHNNLGVARALNDDFDQAGLHLDSALRLIGENAAVLNNLGNYQLCRGRISEALSSYRRSYELDSLDKRKLFNWSLALYLSGSADEAVRMMGQFLEYYNSAGDSAQVMAWLQEEGFMKGETQVTTTAEIKRLMDKAKLKMKEALERKSASSKAKTDDSVSTNQKEKSAKRKRTIPAGGKALESSSITALLYWIVM